MFSVMNTGMNFLPLCTAKVSPTKSGETVERRDQVLMTFLDCSLCADVHLLGQVAVDEGALLYAAWHDVAPQPFLPRRRTMNLSVRLLLRVL